MEGKCSTIVTLGQGDSHPHSFLSDRSGRQMSDDRRVCCSDGGRDRRYIVCSTVDLITI